MTSNWPDWVRSSKSGDRIYYYDGFAKGVGKRLFKRTTDPEATVAELVAEASKLAGLSVARGTTMRDMFGAWLNAHYETSVEGTFRRRWSAMNTWLIPNIGDLPVADMNLAAYLKVGDALVKSGCSSTTFDSVLQTLTVMCHWGIERDWLPEDAIGSPERRRRALRALRNQTKAVGVRSAEDTDREQGITLSMVPSWDDVCELADAMADRVGGITMSRTAGERYGAAVRLAAGTGLRQCELLGLTVSSIDMSKGIINLGHQLDRYVPWKEGTAMPTAPLKYAQATGQHRRRVVVWKKVKPDLELLLAQAEGDYLIPPFKKQVGWADAWGRALHQAIEAVGWKWKGHWLRHHYGSVSLAPKPKGMGMSISEVQHSMGHKDPGTTLRTYIQLTEEMSGWVE